MLTKATPLTAAVKTKEEWMATLRCYSADYLAEQLAEPLVAKHNFRAYGAAWSDAIHELIQEKLAFGATLCKRKARPVGTEPVEDVDPSRIELVPYGGKGGVVRIVHPKE